MSAPKPGARAAEALRRRLGLSYEHVLGLRFGINVFIASTIVWGTLRFIGDSNPIWAIASMVAAADPQPEEARRMFRSRLVNVAVGCTMGSLFLVVGGQRSWILPTALAATVIVSTWFVRVKTMWRQGPITAAVVIAAGLTGPDSTQAGLQHGLHKVAEVVFGSVVGVVVSAVLATLWLIPPPGADETAE